MWVSHISHFAFTEALSPLLKTTSKEDGADVRIVTVSTLPLSYLNTLTDTIVHPC